MGVGESQAKSAWLLHLAALTCAVEEEIITRNPVAVIRLPVPRKSKQRVWTVDEARRFLESARHDCDPLYAAYVLIVVLGLRKGEVLGLTWNRVDLDAAEFWRATSEGQGSAHPSPGQERIIRSAATVARAVCYSAEAPPRRPVSRPRASGRRMD